MREKKIKVFIGILLTLIMFASSVALMMYSKQNELKKQIESQTEVYVSGKDLREGDKIGAGDIVLKRLPKSYVNFTPLTKEEIIGRFAKTAIFANEPLRPEKITLTKVIREGNEEAAAPNIDVLEHKQPLERLSADTVSISLELFKNLDVSLQKGDFIDIVSVSPSKKKSDDNSFSTTYIALHVKIHSFANSVKEMQKAVYEEYNEKTKQSRRSVADTLILEMSPSEIKNFLAMYYKTQELNAQRVYNTKENRGHLWMVKCSSEPNDIYAKEKAKLLLKEKIRKVRVKSRPKAADTNEVKIVYEE